MFLFNQTCSFEMSKTVIKISENLMLRRVDPNAIYEAYVKGQYKNLKIPQAKVKVVSTFMDISKKIGNDPSYEVYRLTDKSNTSHVIVTTGHSQYQSALTHSEDKAIKCCKWCRRKIEGPSLGIPVIMDIDTRTNKVTFGLLDKDHFDRFECMFAVLKRKYSCHHMYKDPLYTDAEQMAHCMYYRMYPNKIGTRIKEANDWDLLHSNGGPLSDEEFDSNTHTYVEIPNLITVPVKKQYIKLNIVKK